MTQLTGSNSQQLIERLSRQSGDSQKETTLAVSSSKGPSQWIAKVISKYDYNWYNVAAVETGPPGTMPTVLGNLVLALNTAEPFLSQGTLASGTYVIISRIGDKYVFHAKV